jgi:hypothetical protein
MFGPQKTLEREALLRRHRELQAEIAQHERNLREGEARLSIGEQLRLILRRFLEANIPELAGKGFTSQRINRFVSNCGLSRAGLRWPALLYIRHSQQ